MKMIVELWNKWTLDFMHLALAVVVAYSLTLVMGMDSKMVELEKSLELKSQTLLWTTAQRDVLQDFYYNGEVNVATVEEWVVLAEYEKFKGTTDRAWDISRIVEAIHLLTQGRYRDRGDGRTHEIAKAVYESSKEFKLPCEVVLAVAWGERRYRGDICTGYMESPVGAVGCMQVMPFWAEALDFVADADELRYDLHVNIRAGAAVLRYYLDRPMVKGEHPLKVALLMYQYGESAYRSRTRRGLGFNGYAERVIKKAVQIKKKVRI